MRAAFTSLIVVALLLPGVVMAQPPEGKQSEGAEPTPPPPSEFVWAHIASAGWAMRPLLNAFEPLDGFCSGRPGGIGAAVTRAPDFRLLPARGRLVAVRTPIARGGAMVAATGAAIALLPALGANCVVGCSDSVFTETTMLGLGVMVSGGLLSLTDEGSRSDRPSGAASREAVLLPFGPDADARLFKISRQHMIFEPLTLKGGGGASITIGF